MSRHLHYNARFTVMKTAFSASNIVLFSLFLFSENIYSNNSLVNTYNRDLYIASKEDSTAFPHAEARFSNDDKTSNFINAEGLSVRYFSAWERDYRSTDDLLLYLRPYDKNAPYVFREMLTISSEGLVDDNKKIEEYAEMMLNITSDTWSRYNVDVQALSQEVFELNGMQAYRVRMSLPRLSQEHLLVFFKYNSKAYTIEYIATDVSFDIALESVWKLINSVGFVER